MIGQRFNRLEVIAFHSRDKHKNERWVCKCDCGTEKAVLRQHLRNGHVQSCGCMRSEMAAAATKKAAAERRSTTKSTYKGMVRRCHDERSQQFRYYGAKGVSVCDRWLYGDGTKTGWECFFEDMGPKPEGLTLERKNPYRGYSPDNCKWATWAEQQQNRRKKN